MTEHLDLRGPLSWVLIIVLGAVYLPAVAVAADGNVDCGILLAEAQALLPFPQENM